MKQTTFISLLFFISFISNGQILPSNRSVNWKNAGYKGTIPDYTTIVNINHFGGDSTGVLSNNTAFVNAVNSLSGATGVIYFPKGTYLFTSSISLNSGLILRGYSSDSTVLKFNLGGSIENAIKIIGAVTSFETALSSDAFKDSTSINVVSAANFSSGDVIKLSLNDSSLVTSNWAYGSVGQIVKIANSSSNKLFLESALRLNYSLLKKPKIKKLTTISNVGIECLKLQRLDATTSQTSTICYNYASNCWVRGVESDMCNFSHIEINNSTNIKIFDSYFHHAFAYGGNGQGYGIVCQVSSGECLIENNIFKHLRHSMLLQSGANGNVFGYNYSVDPFWSQSPFPTNSAGDIVLHGNYPYANLFEGNICQNIVIDDSHGSNGPYNTFFRNRGELYGIFMNSAPASNDQNFIGNEITNTGMFLGFYNLNGTGHFEYGNNIKGTVSPAGTTTLTDQSYYYTSQPSFLQNLSSWPSIGINNAINMGTIPAKQRYFNNNFTLCNAKSPTDISEISFSNEFLVFPNPSNGHINLQLANKNTIKKFIIYNITGAVMNEFYPNNGIEQTLDLSMYDKGIYYIRAFSTDKNLLPVKIILQ